MYLVVRIVYHRVVVAKQQVAVVGDAAGGVDRAARSTIAKLRRAPAMIVAPVFWLEPVKVRLPALTVMVLAAFGLAGNGR